jgi:acyl-CoA synthetase (AMP-forming)/AMP-acid ligase II
LDILRIDRAEARLQSRVAAETLDARLRAQAAAYPDRPAVLDDAGTLSYRELDAQVSGVAAALQRHGVIPGEHVALLLGNGRECLVAYFGAVRAGAVPVPLHLQLTAEELRRLLRHSEAAAVLAEPGCTATVDAVRAELPARRYLVAPIGAGAATPPAADRATGRRAVPAGWECLAAERGVLVAVRADPEDIASLHYTSGTAGAPKGVLHTHRAVLAVADAKAAAYGVHDRSILYCSPPLYHVAAWSSIVHVALLVAGGAVALTRRREPAWVADLLAARRVTFMWTVPTTYLLLLDLPDLAARDLSALEATLFAAMSMPREGIERLHAALPHVRLITSYGQTEAGAGTILQGEELLRRPGSVGRPLPGNDVRVVDPAGRDCPPATVGDISLRGPGRMLGYYKDPGATAAILRDGWVHTGDVGYLDPEGYLYVLGRAAETINCGGVMINPAEVEEALLRHPAVREAAVIGLPDPYYGQTVAAVVALHEPVGVISGELQTHCRALLAPHKVPARVEIVPALPRNALGKVQKQIISATFRDQA